MEAVGANVLFCVSVCCFLRAQSIGMKWVSTIGVMYRS